MRAWTSPSSLSSLNEIDPYRLDSPAWHRRAAWFTEQLDRFVPFGTVQLRGLHYKLSAAGDVLLPDGRPYPNDATWEWLNDKAAKAARWLGYVPFDPIIDERSAAPPLLPSRKQSRSDPAGVRRPATLAARVTPA
jgi:hypothetical protein